MTEGFHGEALRQWPLTRRLLLVTEGFHELIYEDGVHHVYMRDGRQVVLNAVQSLYHTPRHPREAGRRASIEEVLIESAVEHPMAVFAIGEEAAIPLDDLPGG